MEKSIHSHLFAALVSTKEQRLAFKAPEKPEDHDTLEQQIEKDLKDPSKDQADIQRRIDELQGSKHLTAGSNVGDWTALREKAKTRNEEINALKEALAMTSDDAFKKIEADMKNGDGESGSAKIVEMLGKIAVIADPATRPHNAVLLTQAYNDVITKIQGLDPDNKITLVQNGLGGADDDKMLENAKKAKEVTFQPGGAIATAVENFDKPNQLPQTKEIAKQALIDAVKNRKEELWAEISAVVTHDPQVVDSQKIVQEYLDQIKEIVKLQNEKINGVPPATPATPPETPNDPQTAANADPKAPKSIFDTVTDAFKNAIGDISTLAQDFVKKGTDAFNTLQDSLTKEQKDKIVEKLNEELKKKGESKRLEVNKDGRIVEAAKDGATTDKEKSGETTKEPEEKEKTQLEKLLAFFKELIDFLRGESVKNGDIGALKAELESTTSQIKEIEKTQGFEDKKPEVLRQFNALVEKQKELELKIKQGTKITDRAVTDAEGFIRSSPAKLRLRTGKDRQGNAFIACTENTPEARGHLSYMTGRLQQIHPGLGFNQQAAGGNQRVSFHFHGDVNINSKNTTDNSRTINNTNNVSGRNNTVSASADGSQNGANTQEQIGGVGAEQDGSARNRARLTPDVQVQPAPIPQPRRARIVDVPPPTGNLS